MAKTWGILAFLHLTVVTADLQVFLRSEPLLLLADFLDEEANFGDDIPKRGLSTMVVMADPEDACSPIAPPPLIPNLTGSWAVLIKRYNCTFQDKVLNAQIANYDAAIVHNVGSNKLEIMNASNPDELNIVSVFISENAGKEIKANFLYEKGVDVVIQRNSSADILGKILIPFVVVISVCFIFTIGVMVFKCIKDYRRTRRRRLPYTSLNKIPTAKFKKNDPFETCAICLDDFVEGEKLRILPCSHAYHCKCIDPWLTKNRRVCPLCKRRVLAGDETIDSDDDDSSSDDFHTPLLRGVSRQIRSTYGGTTTVVRIHDMTETMNQRLPFDEVRRIITDARQRQALVAGPSSVQNQPENLAKRPNGKNLHQDSGSGSSVAPTDSDSEEGPNPFQDASMSLPDNLSFGIASDDNRDDNHRHQDDHRHDDDHHHHHHEDDHHHHDDDHHHYDDHYSSSGAFEC